MRKFTNEELLQMVTSKEITNKYCYFSGAPIYFNEGYYVLNHKEICEEVDIDALIFEETSGILKNTEEAYSDDSDFFFYTENGNERCVVNDIVMDGGFYSNNEWEEIEFVHTHN